jgi:uncharacterized membrane protein YgcG
MRTEAKRVCASNRAWLCAAALSLAALAQGCSQFSSAPAGGGNAARPEALLAQATPAQTPQPTPAQTSPTAESPLPPPKGFVNDFANVIDARTEELLEAKLGLLKASARIEFAVATVETTGGQDILDYSLAVARGWGIGPPAGEGGGGLLLMFAVKDRKWRLQVSRSLEADLPNDMAGEMGKVMLPSLRAGHYGDAATKYVDALIKRLAERRGFSMKEEELNLQTLPEEKSKPAEKPKAGERRKSKP